MDVTRFLEIDHRAVERLFDEIRAADGARRARLVEELATDLRNHMQLEEQVVYPAMTPATGESEATEGEIEHRLARSVLTDLVNLVDQPGFGAALAGLEAIITHHVDEEETEVFPMLRAEGQALLDGMTERFLTTRRSLGLPCDGATLAESATKADLETLGRAGGIPGISTMTKAALADAVMADADPAGRH